MKDIILLGAGGHCKSVIDSIENTDFDDEINIIKNKNHCKYCEFNKLCNNVDINYEILEEDIYGP